MSRVGTARADSAPIPKRMRRKSVSFNAGVGGVDIQGEDDYASNVAPPVKGPAPPVVAAGGASFAMQGIASEREDTSHSGLPVITPAEEARHSAVVPATAPGAAGATAAAAAGAAAATEGVKRMEITTPSSQTTSPMTTVGAGETPAEAAAFSPGWDTWGSARRPAHKRRLSVPKMDEYAAYEDEVDEMVEEEGEDEDDEEDGDTMVAVGSAVPNRGLHHSGNGAYNDAARYSWRRSSPSGFASDGENTYRQGHSAASGRHSTAAAVAAAADAAASFSDWDVGRRYRVVRILGHGSYGEVAEAWDRLDEKQVAIKRILGIFDQEVDAKRIYREMHILRHLRHDEVIRLVDVLKPRDFSSFRDLYLVFEYVDTDLYKLILSPQYLTNEHIKTFLYQMLVALKYIHTAHVIHRDIKPANILVNEDCTLKVCDFGLARVVCPETIACTSERDPDSDGKAESALDDSSSGGGASGSEVGADGLPSQQPRTLKRQLTKHVVTRWYRAPELILLQDYTNSVDVWSLGCIFAELLSMQKESVPRHQDRMPLFPGKSCFPLSADVPTTYTDKLDQLNVIFDVIGTPSDEDIAALGEVQQYLTKLPPQERRPLETMYSGAQAEALDLLRRMLQFNPARRVTVEEALEHPYLASCRKRHKEVKAGGPIRMELENTRLDRQTLKEHVYREVLMYHPPARETNETAALDALDRRRDIDVSGGEASAAAAASTGVGAAYNPPQDI